MAEAAPSPGGARQLRLLGGDGLGAGSETPDALVAERRMHAVHDQRLDGDVAARRGARRRTRASSTASRRGEVTSTNACSTARRAAPARSLARSRKPSSIPSNARKNATTSSMTSVPTTRDDGAQERLHRRARDPQVRAGRHHQQPEDPVVEQAREPPGRVEEVERVARRRRVDDDEVEAALARAARAASPSPCTPACPDSAPDDVAVEAVVEDALRLLGVGGVRGRRGGRTSTSCRASAPRVVRSAGRRPPGPSVAGRSRAACSRACSSPSVLASRLAGSIVTTTALRPRRAPSSASTAAVVVLPTPPVPQQTTTWRVVDDVVDETLAHDGHATHSAVDSRRAERVGERVDLGRPEVGA